MAICVQSKVIRDYVGVHCRVSHASLQWEFTERFVLLISFSFMHLHAVSILLHAGQKTLNVLPLRL